MNYKNDHNIALEVLLAVRTELAHEIDEKLIQQCFEIQHKHQFSQSREQSASAMERLIDAAIPDNIEAEGRNS
jgi:hypothetical protein